MSDEPEVQTQPVEPPPEEEEDERFQNRPEVQQTADATGVGASTIPLDPHAAEQEEAPSE